MYILSYHEKSYAVGSVLMSRIQITFQNENITSTFWNIVENATKSNMPSRRNYDVMIIIMTYWLQLWCNAFLESLTLNISGKESDTDIILSLLDLLNHGYHLAFCFHNWEKNDFLRYHVGSILMSGIQITIQNENISPTFWDIVENLTKSNMPSRCQLWCNDYNYDVLIAIMM